MTRWLAPLALLVAPALLSAQAPTTDSVLTTAPTAPLAVDGFFGLGFTSTRGYRDLEPQLGMTLMRGPNSLMIGVFQSIPVVDADTPKPTFFATYYRAF
jgi:hypothetical protein